ncbi:MAG: hypothetical protein CM15mP51_20880 [Porticoccaceae bacterium]|nr:MAG: hypothetical protein CM15mP51_20880 [Porticoccaceae bacterium]
MEENRLKDGGDTLFSLLKEIKVDCAKFSGLSSDIDELLKSLNTASDQCKNALDHLLNNSEKAPYIAYNQMMLFGNSFAYWLLVKAIGKLNQTGRRFRQ